MKPLDRDSILQAKDRAPVEVKVPEWGGAIFVRPMSGAERDGFEAEMVGQGNRMTNLRARLAVRVVCDAEGNRLFKDEDAAAVGERSAAALDRIFRAAQKLNSLGDQEVAAAGKDSASDQSGASGSGSPSPSA
jgi:hypothetical protein